MEQPRRIYAVTSDLLVGAFASPERGAWLRTLGVTDLLNVSDARSWVSSESHGFRRVVWVPIADCVPIMEEDLETCFQTLDSMRAQAGAKVFVHCMAGQNRAPTVLWLYLQTLGHSPEAAKALITNASPDALPGHPLLLSTAVLELTQQWRSRQKDTVPSGPGT